MSRRRPHPWPSARSSVPLCARHPVGHRCRIAGPAFVTKGNADIVAKFAANGTS
ncbi:hypothetical protein ACFWIJ_29765 [Streptomyces sp. NPDC127079]|uniref:hypothetical protein n=1 Tax=Streptomyces sp. NPDC127079 TaxID=3347132 RepID=UPI003667AFB8